MSRAKVRQQFGNRRNDPGESVALILRLQVCLRQRLIFCKDHVDLGREPSIERLTNLRPICLRLGNDGGKIVRGGKLLDRSRGDEVRVPNWVAGIGGH